MASHTDKVVVEYPIGHRRRREEGIPVMFKKFEGNASAHYPADKVKKMMDLFKDQNKLENTPVNELMDLFAV